MWKCGPYIFVLKVFADARVDFFVLYESKIRNEKAMDMPSISFGFLNKSSNNYSYFLVVHVILA